MASKLRQIRPQFHNFGFSDPDPSSCGMIFRPILLLHDDSSTYSEPLNKRAPLIGLKGSDPSHILSCCTTTFRSGQHFVPILLPWDDISMYPAAPARHFDLSCCSSTTFQFNSTYPATPGRHFDLSCGSEMTFLLRYDISTYSAKVGHSNALTLLGTFLCCQHASQIDICDEVDDRIKSYIQHASLNSDKLRRSLVARPQ